MKIPKSVWITSGVLLIISGLGNIGSAGLEGQHGYYHPPNLTRGYIFLVLGLVIIGIGIVLNQKKRNSNKRSEDF